MRWTVYPQSSFVERREGRLGHARIGMYVDHQKGLVDIYSVRVPVAHRGKGEARRALDAALQAVDALRYDAVLAASPLDRRTRRHDLERFYASRGFRPTGRTINTAGDREMWRARRPQRDVVFDKKKLHKEIDADLKKQAKRKLAQLRADLAAAHRHDREACGRAKLHARERIERLRRRRDTLQEQIRRLTEKEHQARRAACGTDGKSKHVRKSRRVPCGVARSHAKTRLLRLRQRREKLRGLTRGLVLRERVMRNETCNAKTSAAARAKLQEEKNFQASLKRSAAFERNRHKKPSLRKASERQSESDDEVRHNIPPHLVGLFNRVKKGIKGSARKSRTEEFLEYVEEHPDEEFADADDAADALIADLERQMRSGRRDFSRRTR